MRFRTHLLVGSLGIAVLSMAGIATAADSDAQDGEFSVQSFHPAPGPDNFITVEGARTHGKMAWSAGMFFNYANSPFVVKSCESETNCNSPNAVNDKDISVVSDMFTADLMGTLTPIPRLQIGLRVPLSFVNGDGVDTTTGMPSKGGLSGFGIGDPYLEGKYRFFGDHDTPLVLAGGAFFSGPVGHAMAENKFIGYSSPVGGIRGIADFHAGALSLGANLTGLYRGKAKLGTTTLGPEFRYGVAAGYAVSPVIKVVAEGYGGTKFSTQNGTNSMEGLLGAQITPLQSRFTFTVGGGGGVLQGVGVPLFRAFAGVMYAHAPQDADGDGIMDDADKCPDVAEDLDGYQDQDGCPEPDNDGDTIPDEKDKCPNKPETVNEWKDTDGCPDEVPDRDKDGIQDGFDKCPDAGGDVVRVKGKFYGCPDTDKDGVPDKVDKCPAKPEDTDGYKDEDGCPDPDNDGDGVMDVEDQCVDVPGTKQNHGCPEEDTDKDGIIDRLDKCPKKPENYNGYKDDDGCPDARRTLVQQTATKIEIKGSVQFATNSAKIIGGRSFKILDGVASLLVHNKRIRLIQVEGHTDNRGKPAKNLTLSQKRAESVVAYLVKQGVEPERLTAKGFGQDKPIADNKTRKGRQKNRRVEFNIVKQVK